MNNFRFIAVAILGLFMSATVFAQQGVFTLHAGLAAPMGDFADDDLDDLDALGAGLGFNVGAKYAFPISTNGWSIFGALDINLNGLKKGYKDDLEDTQPSSADFTFNKYYNIPISAGVEYAKALKNNKSFFVDAGLAYNTFKSTKYEVEVGDQKLTVDADNASNLGLRIGAGIYFTEKIFVSAHYYSLSQHTIKFNQKLKNPKETKKGSYKAKPNMTIVNVSIGFKL